MTWTKGTIGIASGRSPLAFACVLLTLAVFASLCVGRYPISPDDLLHFIITTCGGNALPADHYALLHSIFIGSRLPRIAGAAIIGASLAVAGTTYQAVFRNPLISPDLVGVLSGSGFGAALGIVYDTGPFGIQILAFLGGLCAVAVSVIVARSFGTRSMLMLVFGGLVSTALFTALLSILKYTADPERQLPDIVFWLLGSLTQLQLRQLPLLTGALAGGLFVLSSLGRMLDALSMGDEEARTLGVPVEALRFGAIGMATILAALTVSTAGMIGWLGLIVPHIARLIGGPANGRLLPLAACFGALFLLVCDDLARTLSEEEIPVGILVDLFGVITFLAVLRFLRRGLA